MSKKLYAVTAYRWGDQSDHSYLVGIFTSKVEAKIAAEFHADYRGGKYACVVDECEADHFNNNDDNHSKEIYRAKSTRG